MTHANISRLSEVPVREAWPNEATNFTPWLYEHLDQLGDAVGLQLEPEGREVAVGPFCADILARNTLDDSLVLIENQLEASDHTHLGQIMTYLAGLDARAVIWVASAFRESHVSAVKWLNDHTDDSFGFFAVQLRVVRIADSPLAPMLEVVARPNAWERRLHAIAESGRSELSQQRLDFWTAYCDLFPDEIERDGPPSPASNRWRHVGEHWLLISYYVAAGRVGLGIRGHRGSSDQETRAALLPHADELTRSLGVECGDGPTGFFWDRMAGDFKNPAQWNDLATWLHSRVAAYEAALQSCDG